LNDTKGSIRDAEIDLGIVLTTIKSFTMLFTAFLALFLAPFAIATASDQFKLKPQEDASRESLYIS